MKIGIIPNYTRNKTKDVVKKTLTILNELKIDYVITDDDNNEKNIYSNLSEEFYKNSDLIIAIGGDGSFIRAAKESSKFNKPVLCINAGNLAFLAGLECNELDLLKELITGNYSKEKRMMLEVNAKINGNTVYSNYCLNDIVVARGNQIKLVELDVLCDNRKINSYRADGVIISTPTGSTAYSWSAGGPVIDPNLQCIMLTPICTHSPLNRSLVFNDNSIINVKSSNDIEEKLLISTDGGESVELYDNFEINIKKSKMYAEFIRIKSDEFFDILNSKLTQRRF